MDPILTVLRIGDHSRTLGTYGLMMAVAIMVGSLMATRAGHRAGLDLGSSIAALGFTVGGALVGAGLLFVAVEAVRTGDLLTAFRNGGGLVFYGAPMGGAVALWLSARKLELNPIVLLDAGIAGVPAAHAMGRIGCFMGGCCFGTPWEGPWAVRYTHPIAPASFPAVLRHPVPLYESGLLLALALALTLWRPRKLGSGLRVSIYLASYGCIRIVTELFRGDAIRGVAFGVSTSQLISTFLIGLGGWLWWRSRASLPLMSK